MSTQGDASALFAVPDLKRRGLWDLNDSATVPDVRFFCSPFGDVSKRADIVPANAGFFSWPVEGLKGSPPGSQGTDDTDESLLLSEESPLELEPADQPKDGDQAGADATADWLQLALAPETSRRPQCNTWNALSARAGVDSPALKPVFLSEAGPGAYDAAIAEAAVGSDPATEATVIQSKVYFAALLALAMGRESVLFCRMPSLPKFESVLAKIRIPGHSHQVLQGLQSTCLRCGKLSIVLRAHVKAIYASQPSQCSVALAGVIDKALLLVQSTVGPYGQSHDSTLELQSTVQRVLVILSAFYDLVTKLPPASSDKKILDVVFAQADVANSQGGAVRDMMQEVLRRVSRPWVEFLEEWIGLRRESGIPFTLGDVGRQKCFVKVESETTVDSEGLDIEETDFHLDTESMPKFIPADVSRQLFEAGRHLRFVKANHPEHVLSRIDISTLGPPEMGWLFDWGSVLEREKQVASFRATLYDAISSRDRESARSRAFSHFDSDSALTGGWSLFGAGEADIERQILQSIQLLNRPVAASQEPDPQTPDLLSSAVQRQLLPSLAAESRPYAVSDQAPHWSLLPVLSFGPLVTVQSAIINRESLRLLFDTHRLGDHLERLRGFYLLGNAWFCRRLSHALFDPNMESAERKAGVALHAGATMGLRLGNRSSWPPASSELRLALMGLLSESQTARDSGQPPLGEMSFSVRNLPPDEVEKCLDATSLQALDFLRLSYQPPDPLASIISSSAILKCDTIFKLLLRMLRMQFVVGQVSRELTCRAALKQPPKTASLLFAAAANHFVTTISAYFLNTAIAVPWRDFTLSMDQIRANLSTPDVDTFTSIPGPEQTRNDLQQVLDRMLEGLFLRKRQQPVMKLLEEILGLILEFAKQQNPSVTEDSQRSCEEMHHAFKQNVHLFITVCKGLADESRSRRSRARKGTAGGQGQESTIVQLVFLLDFSSFYAKE